MNEPRADEHRFQVDLRGILAILSDHLYSGPQVYLRELLQNAVDAIHARRQEEPSITGEIILEVIESKNGTPTLTFEDNGVGLTESDIHQFLATIGQSSKRGDLIGRRDDYLGQFGIGLLSCFMVSDEIVVISTSIIDGEKTCEWRGKADGTYNVRVLNKRLTPGTQVFLHPKPRMAEFLKPEKVLSLARKYGEFLPYPIIVRTSHESVRINRTPPWESAERDSDSPDAPSLLQIGREEFGTEFLDAFSLRSEIGQVRGIAFVLPYSSGLIEQRADRVYLKGILCTEKSNDLLPKWAFFVKCIFNVRDLSPTASRESFHESEKLELAKESLGQSLRDALVSLATTNDERLQQLVSLHQVAIKGLALEDEECIRLFGDWLPFITSMGPMCLAEIRQRTNVIYFAVTVEQFQQIAPIAAAQSLLLVNAGYIYDQQVLERLPLAFPLLTVVKLTPELLCREFREIAPHERAFWGEFNNVAQLALEPYDCGAELREFYPAELPALFTTNSSANFLRSVQQTQDVSDSFWSDVLEQVGMDSKSSATTRLIFNANNRLIHKIAENKKPHLQKHCVELLYAQSLLMGHYPLREKELKLLNDGILKLLDWSTDNYSGT
ncbi:HSP90 family protein [bacterium]|nr:HSP90 family protein [bacterium]